jgi:hypothetical protein
VRERTGAALQVLGLVLMPVALYLGMREGGSLGDELLVAFTGFLLFVIGRGLRGGGAAK